MANLSFYQYFGLNNSDEAFSYLHSSFQDTITTWDYFVNWSKVFANIKCIEKELNILNYLIGKPNFEEEAFHLIQEYPDIIKTFPSLIACREKSLNVLIDPKNFSYKEFNFKKNNLTSEEINDFVRFMNESGIREIIENRRVKNLVDYVCGVEVGLDSNGRKNRCGTLMENLVEIYIKDICQKMDMQYMPQATAEKIYRAWGLIVKVDKSSRKIDFAINKNGKLFFIEVNFYGGGGSKLKSTATEYIYMSSYWEMQNIQFIWVTDGNGWQTTLKPLREYFERADYLLNLELLKNNGLKLILAKNV